jgi:leucyl-tRNA synthetase
MGRRLLREIEFKWKGKMRNVFPNNIKDNSIDNSKNNTNYNSMDNTKDNSMDNTKDNTNYNTKDITNDNIHTHTCTHANEKYILSMFPYPSGNLHMGHARVYSISDCLARFQTLKRHRVFHPMGWDSFGLPAENAAIGAGIQPADWTERNISQMRTQLHSLGFDFNWEAELRTSDPKYYKWTQWLFIKMHQRGWAYRKEAPVFWDPVDCTVLAAEQVDTQGRSWRSGAKVETRMLAQWYWKITEFADDLIVGLEKLDWPDSIKEMQKNWIGKVEACTIDFPIENDTIKGKAE